MRCPHCGAEIAPQNIVVNVKEKKGSGIGCVIGIIVGFFLLIFLIGIFAAISYPQYLRAIEKSRAAEGYTLAKALSDAQHVYQFSTGKYTTKFVDLDIEIPESKATGNILDTKLFVYEIDLPYIKAKRKDDSHFQYSFIQNIETQEIKCEGENLICQYFE